MELIASPKTLVTTMEAFRPDVVLLLDMNFYTDITTKREGSGIGLSLSRQIMRAHNGTLDLTRSDSERTEFTMVFR